MRDGKESIAIIKAAMKKQIIPSDMHGYFALRMPTKIDKQPLIYLFIYLFISIVWASNHLFEPIEADIKRSPFCAPFALHIYENSKNVKQTRSSTNDLLRKT